jgi:hypothetical protein
VRKSLAKPKVIAKSTPTKPATPAIQAENRHGVSSVLDFSGETHLTPDQRILR